MPLRCILKDGLTPILASSDEYFDGRDMPCWVYYRARLASPAAIYSPRRDTTIISDAASARA